MWIWVLVDKITSKLYWNPVLLITNGIKKSIQRNHEFRYLSRHAGKGKRESVKRIHECNNEEVITKSYIDRQSIESKIIEYNTKHFQQAHQSIAYKDKIYDKLKKDEMRNKVLNGEIEEQECDDSRVFEFLKLLKRHLCLKQRFDSLLIWGQTHRWVGQPHPGTPCPLPQSWSFGWPGKWSWTRPPSCAPTLHGCRTPR